MDVGRSLTDFRFPYPTRLDRWPAERTKPGKIGGRSSSSTIDGPGLPGPGLPGTDPLLPVVSDSAVVLEAWGRVDDRIRDKARGVIGWPASGDAVITVPGVAMGAGLGLVDRNRGCTSSSRFGADMG